MDKKSASAYSLALAGIIIAAFTATEGAATPMGSERFPRWYIGLEAGGTMTHDSDVSGTSAGSVSIENGFSYGGSLGYMPAYRTGPGGFRVELEVFHKEAGIDAIESGGVSTALNGDFKTTSYMANVFYDFNTDTSVLPYIGAGIGWSNVSVDSNSGLGNTTDSDDVLAWQGLLGFNYLPATIPYTMFNLGYRFHATENSEFGTATGTIRLDASYTHSVEAGMKFRF